jgi:hypothetical protein
MSARTPPFVPHEHHKFSRESAPNRPARTGPHLALGPGDSHASGRAQPPQSPDQTKQRRMPDLVRTRHPRTLHDAAPVLGSVAAQPEAERSVVAVVGDVRNGTLGADLIAL